MVRTSYYYLRAMVVLVLAMAAATVVAGGVALGVQEEPSTKGTTQQDSSSSTSFSDVQPAATIDNPVAAWGFNRDGQLGDGTTTNRNTPVGVHSFEGIDIRDIESSGSFHSLALKSDGTVWAWGDNRFGQLGDGTTTDRRNPSRVPNLSGVTGIEGGHFHSLAKR